MSTTVPTRVVVADDSAMMRQIVSSSLTRAGIQVVGSASNGDQALEVCERERPDALMLDLTMPGLDGIAATEALQFVEDRLGIATAGVESLTHVSNLS